MVFRKALGDSLESGFPTLGLLNGLQEVSDACGRELRGGGAEVGPDI